jgi:hypothetical protein
MKQQCKCGGIITKDKYFTEGFLVTSMRCQHCEEVFFTPEQTKELIRLHKANEEIEGERKIIKVGTSIAALLPKKIEKYGINEGAVDCVKVLSTDSIEIRFKKNVF